MKQNATVDFDLVIAGAGPAGLSFARSLADTGLKIAVIEKSSRGQLADPMMDGREIALTHTSKYLLQTLGAWQKFARDNISLIRKAKVLNGRSPYSLDFDHQNTGKDTLGYVVSNHLIKKALFETVADCPTVKLVTDTEVTALDINGDHTLTHLSDGRALSSPLVVAADSRFSTVRRHAGVGTSMLDFGRTAIVCRMTHQIPHRDVAYECFQHGQTLAVLPLTGNTSSIVVTVPSDMAGALLSMDGDSFSADIQRRFEGRLGHMALVGDRFSYPLVATYAKQFVTKRFALIGDAAVGMHPVTAHGFNLGIKGQDTLAAEIKSAVQQQADIGAPEGLARYQLKHRQATWPLYQGTNALVNLYTDETLPARFLRASLLRFGNFFKPGKQLIMNQLTHIPAHEHLHAVRDFSNQSGSFHA